MSRRVELGVSGLRKNLKNRGVIVAGAMLATFLGGTSMIQAAPAVVALELGKMALAGNAAAGAAATAGAVTATKAATTAAVATTVGIKAQVVTAVAAIAIGTGSVFTYKEVTKKNVPAEPVRTTQRQVAETRAAAVPAGSFEGKSVAAEINSASDASADQSYSRFVAGDEVKTLDKAASGSAEEVAETIASEPTQVIETAELPDYGGGYAEEDPNSVEEDEESSTETPSYGGGMGGGMMGGGGGYGGARRKAAPAK